MRLPVRTVFILMVGAAVLAGGGRPRSAFAVPGALQNPANGHWYKLVTSTVKTTWSGSKVNAEALGGYMATITSAAENQWVGANIVPTGYAWLGGSDAVTEGSWLWVSGEPWSYSNWGGVEPNNYGAGEHSLLTNYNGAGKWADAADGGSGLSIYQYVVEWNGDPTPPVPPSPPAAPSGLTASVTNGNPISLTWADGSSDEEGFQVERRTAASAFQQESSTGPNAVAYEDIATAPQVVYTYRVRAVNSGGASDYTNEASVTASALAPAPKAPSNLVVVATTPDSVELTWGDNSLDEISFEVHRRTKDGYLGFLAARPADSYSFTDGGLRPDSEFVYAVRSVNAYRTSAFVEVAASTPPTMAVTTLRADLKDSPKPGKDSLKVSASFDFLPGTPDGLFDPLAEGITLRAGTDASPVVMVLPANLEGWKVKGAKATWKSPKGSTPKYKIQVDLEDRIVTASATGLDLAVPPGNPMRVSLGFGNDGGTEKRDWTMVKAGTFRVR